MAELINERDTLNEGRKKINKAITHADEAKQISEQADTKATEALNKSESTQEQLNQVVIDGDSSVEAAQARVDEKGQTHSTLKDRIDDGFTKVNSQLADTEQEIKDDISSLNYKLDQMEDMTPKGAFATLQDLENAYPNGTSGVFIVQDNGHWYYWNGINWADGGQYQATPWDVFMTEQDEEWVI